MALRQHLPQKPYLPPIRVERKTPQPGILDYIAGLGQAYERYQGQELKMKQFEAQIARQNVLDQRSAEETEYRRQQDALNRQDKAGLFDYRKSQDALTRGDKERVLAETMRTRGDSIARNQLVFDAITGSSDQSVNDPYGLGVHDSQIPLTEQQRVDKIKEAMGLGLTAGGGVEALQQSELMFNPTLNAVDSASVGLDSAAQSKYNQFLAREQGARDEQKTALEEALMSAYNDTFGDDANNFEMIGYPEGKDWIGGARDAVTYIADAAELPGDASRIDRAQVLADHRAGIPALAAKLAQPQANNPEYVLAVVKEYLAALREYSGQAPGTSGGGYEASELAKTLERAGGVKNTRENYILAKDFKAQWTKDRIAQLQADADKRSGLSLLK